MSVYERDNASSSRTAWILALVMKMIGVIIPWLRDRPEQDDEEK